jgi:hypothetical protein
MTREQLVEAIARDAQERASRASDASVRLAYRREAEAVLESIEAAGWTVVPHETAQALDDSAVLDSLARPNGGT